MDAYFVEIVLHEKDNVPPKMRPDCWPVEEDYSFRMSINGRLTDSLKKSLVETREQAEKLLEHWLPSLEARGYGCFSTTVKIASLGKWEAKWVSKNTDLIKQKLSI